MNLDDMKNAWVAQDRKLDRIMKLNLDAVRETRLTTTRSSLRWLTLGNAIELAILALAIVWLGNMAYENLGEPKFLIPTLLVDLFAIALAGVRIRQLATIASLDYAAPVVTMQKELELLRVLRIRASKWTFIASCVLWAPALVVLMRGAIGLDAYRILAVIRASDANFFNWIVANLAFGLGLALVVIWFAKRFAGRFESSPFVRSFMDDLAGRSLTNALRSVESIARFEDESRAGDDASI